MIETSSDRDQWGAVTNGPHWLREKARCRPYTMDAVTAAGALAITVMVEYRSRAQTPVVVFPGFLALETLIFGALTFRTARPRLVLIATTLGTLLAMTLAKGSSPVALAVEVAVFTVALRTDRRTAVRSALIVGPLMVVGASWRVGGWLEPENVALLGWVGFAAACGDAGRNKKAYFAAVEERVRRAEQTREEEARRQVIEERLRIARELHDVVAHHIAVIHVQAGVAEHLMAGQPEAAAQALGHVRHASRAVLDELSGLLSVLRQPDDPVGPTDPAPGLDQLTSLVDSFAASGLRVDWQLRGDPQSLPSAVDLVAYRLVQEGLTNAHKHGTGSATLGVAFEGANVAIDIVNPNPSPSPGDPADSADSGAGNSGTGRSELPGNGHGLIGMRERARAVGGTVLAAPQRDGTWRVRALLPLQAAT